MQITRPFLITLSLPFFFQFAAHAEPKLLVDLDQGQGNVEFLAIGMPSALKIRGKGASPKGWVTIAGKQASGKISVSLDAFDTGLKLRNEHMKKKYLETDRYPQAILTITRLNLPGELKSEGSFADIPFEGTLALHGAEKPVSGKVKVQRTGAQVEGVASFSTKIADFAIATPSFAGISLTDTVEVTAEFKAPLSEKQ